jgi:hypothetical protein
MRSFSRWVIIKALKQPSLEGRRETILETAASEMRVTLKGVVLFVGLMVHP